MTATGISKKVFSLVIFTAIATEIALHYLNSMIMIRCSLAEIEMVSLFEHSNLLDWQILLTFLQSLR